MKKLTHSLLITLFASSLAATTAVAADQYSTPGEQVNDLPSSETKLPDGLFHRMDVNGDGYIGTPEAARSEELSTAFEDLDHDDDGLLSSEEFSDFEVEFD